MTLTRLQRAQRALRAAAAARAAHWAKHPATGAVDDANARARQRTWEKRSAALYADWRQALAAYKAAKETKK